MYVYGLLPATVSVLLHLSSASSCQRSVTACLLVWWTRCLSMRTLRARVGACERDAGNVNEVASVGLLVTRLDEGLLLRLNIRPWLLPPPTFFFFHFCVCTCFVFLLRAELPSEAKRLRRRSKTHRLATLLNTGCLVYIPLR